MKKYTFSRSQSKKVRPLLDYRVGGVMGFTGFAGGLEPTKTYYLYSPLISYTIIIVVYGVQYSVVDTMYNSA